MEKCSLEQMLTKIKVMIAQGFDLLPEQHPLKIELEYLKKLCKDQEESIREHSE